MLVGETRSRHLPDVVRFLVVLAMLVPCSLNMAVDRDTSTAYPAATTGAITGPGRPGMSLLVIASEPRVARIADPSERSNGVRAVTLGGRGGRAFEPYLAVPKPAPPSTPAAEAAPFAVTNPIVGPPRGSAIEALTFADRAGSTRMPEVERYVHEMYRLAPVIGFDPAILVAQSALETDNWRSDWWTLRLNPAGLGITGTPAQDNASATFANGTLAARAQLAHMHAEVFGHARALHPDLEGVDPTYQDVFDAGWAGTLRTIGDLSGTWAVDPFYAEKIVVKGRALFE